MLVRSVKLFNIILHYKIFFLLEDYYDRRDDGNKTESTTGRNSNGRPSTVLTPLDDTGMTLYITHAKEFYVMMISYKFRI